MIDQNQEEILLEAVVGPELAGVRLDQALASLFTDYSRSRLQGWVREGRVSVNGEQRRPRDKVALHDRLQLRAVVEDQVACVAQDIPLDLVFEDAHILVINKPAGLVVHPAAGNPDGTVQNALLFHEPALSELPRAGIVHRLDKDTTGLMVIARTQAAYKRLVEAIAARQVGREYRALVVGNLPAGGRVDLPIGRHPTQRTRMAVNPLGKPSLTHFRVLQHFLPYLLDNLSNLFNIAVVWQPQFQLHGYPVAAKVLNRSDFAIGYSLYRPKVMTQLHGAQGYFFDRTLEPFELNVLSTAKGIINQEEDS